MADKEALGVAIRPHRDADSALANVVGRISGALLARPADGSGEALHWWQLFLEESVRHGLALLVVEAKREELQLHHRYRSTLRDGSLLQEFVQLRELVRVAINAQARGITL